jgi:hypothetical protein
MWNYHDDDPPAPTTAITLTVAAKVVPIISIWELKVGPAEVHGAKASASNRTGPALGEVR